MKPIKPSLGTILLYGAATFQATQYARAGALLDGGLTTFKAGSMEIALGTLGGLVAGAVVNFSLAYAATQLPAIEAKAEQHGDKGKSARSAKYARIGFYVLLAMSPILVAPANFLSMSKALMGGQVILQAAWALMWSSAMDIAIAMVGFIDKNLVSLGTSVSDAQRVASDAGSEKERRSATLKSRSAKKSATFPSVAATPPAKVYRCECGQTFANRFKYSGHARTCATHKEIKTGKTLIPVEMPTMQKVEKKKWKNKCILRQV